jgi:flagellar biosynthesis/type III secretory pathway protein FliH
MTYVTILNSELLTCLSDQIVISKEEVRCINDINSLVQELQSLTNRISEDKQEAEENGFNEGYSEGLRISQKDAKEQFIEYLDKLTDDVYEKITLQKSEIIDLAIEITKKIVSSIDSDEVVTSIAKTAVSQFKEQDSIKIQVNSEIAEAIQTRLKDKRINADVFPKLEIVNNPNVGILDCIITSEHGVIDASFNEQLKTLKHRLIESL